MISLIVQNSAALLRKPRLTTGDYVRIAKPDIPFRKGYKQNYTNEGFEIDRIATLSPPSYNLIDVDGEKISGKFYEQELRNHTDLFRK